MQTAHIWRLSSLSGCEKYRSAVKVFTHNNHSLYICMLQVAITVLLLAPGNSSQGPASAKDSVLCLHSYCCSSSCALLLLLLGLWGRKGNFSSCTSLVCLPVARRVLSRLAAVIGNTLLLPVVPDVTSQSEGTCSNRGPNEGVANTRGHCGRALCGRRLGTYCVAW
jgi:hypothetical protein